MTLLPPIVFLDSQSIILSFPDPLGTCWWLWPQATRLFSVSPFHHHGGVAAPAHAWRSLHSTPSTEESLHSTPCTEESIHFTAKKYGWLFGIKVQSFSVKKAGQKGWSVIGKRVGEPILELSE